MTFYYEVLVASRYYHGRKNLTYKVDKRLSVGSIVKLQLKNQPVLGLIAQQVSQPKFTTKKLESLELPPLPKSALELIDWIKSYYPASLGSIVQLFLPSSLLNKFKVEGQSNYALPKTKLLPTLSPEQLTAIKTINQSGTYLLHGKTGSGKTRVYQELALKALEDGLSSIILTPEISLTSQLSQRFKEVFGDRVEIWHSHLTAKDRREIWLRILTAAEPLVVIGARSALFSPLKNLGLIIIDEAHESAYKQEQAPYYHTVRVAAKLSGLTKAVLVLGSATPALVDYYMAQQKQTPVITMQKLAISGKKPEINTVVVDLKDRTLFNHHAHFSDLLLKAISQAMAKKEQTLVLMNRRGTARVVVCSNCGWQELCPNCDTPLTYHGDEHLMRCHICGYKASARSNCPVCGSSDILFKSAGTKALISELQSYFPKAVIKRFDSDNKKTERFESNYEAVARGDVDILVGTQMLAKGLDLPKLSVVGVVNADTSLSIPDYTAEEKTYQLISQVLGRVGRGHVKGQAVIQTYSPDSALIKAAIDQNWQKFYDLEIRERQKFMFPPFCHLLKLTTGRASSDSAAKAAQQLAEFITSNKIRVQLSGPAPAFHERQSGRFEWQLIVKSSQRSELLKIIRRLPSGWAYDIDPINLL